MFRASQEPWTEARLAELGPTEHDFQEFKGSGWLWTGTEVASWFQGALSKQVSAFANGAGGRLLIGLDDQGRVDGGVPVKVKPNGTREWLEDLIADAVAPRLSRYNVFEVPSAGPLFGSSVIQPGHAVYVVEIPPSDDAPHQALDHRYYLRIAGKSRPMNHVHVQDILRRGRHPEVSMTRVGPYGEPEMDGADPRGPRVFVSFRAFLGNQGRSLARHVGGEVILPRPLVGREVRRRNVLPDGVHYTQRPGDITFFRYHPVPLFPSQEIFFFQVWIGIHRANSDLIHSGGAELRWRVYADDAVPQMGVVDLSDFGVVQRALAWVREQP